MPTKKKSDSPYSEGGPPQSQKAPGDQYRELIHEVRNLATTVALLHTIFVKRRVLYLVLGIETVIVAACLVALFVFTAINNADTDRLVSKSVDSCRVRNAQVDATRNYLARTVKLQQESQALNARLLKSLNLHLTPRDLAEAQKIQIEYAQALHDYFVAQPSDIQCGAIK